MSRLLTTLLLYKRLLGKYISLEAKIPKNKSIYDVLGRAQIGWALKVLKMWFRSSSICWGPFPPTRILKIVLLW